jgi:hypothetical protein
MERHFFLKENLHHWHLVQKLCIRGTQNIFIDSNAPQDRELLAVLAAIRHFRYLLEGRSFVVFTDHNPLVGALHRRSDLISALQRRHLSFIAEFAPSIRHITGESNIVADTL